MWRLHRNFILLYFSIVTSTIADVFGFSNEEECLKDAGGLACLRMAVRSTNYFGHLKLNVLALFDPESDDPAHRAARSIAIGLKSKGRAPAAVKAYLKAACSAEFDPVTAEEHRTLIVRGTSTLRKKRSKDLAASKTEVVF